MKRRLYRSWLPGAALGVLFMLTAAGAEPPKFEVGQSFPDIVLPSMDDGSPTSIADFRGQKVILHIFASW